jgi:hypothetical protein
MTTQIITREAERLFKEAESREELGSRSSDSSS